MIGRASWRGSVVAQLGLTLLAGPSLAATHEQIIEACREIVRPTFVACVQNNRSQGDLEAVREQCRQSVGRPAMQACVRREEQKEAAGKPAPLAPKLESEASTAPAGAKLAPPPALAPPPRTIADIRAILDREKPDVEKIAARKAKADEQPPAGLAGAALSQFYYDRGSARAALGRARDALEDGLKGLDLAKSVGEFERIVNLTGFIAIRYEDLGDLQKANETLDGLVRLAEAQGKRGATINPLAEMARIAMQSGETLRAGYQLLVDMSTINPNAARSIGRPCSGNFA